MMEPVDVTGNPETKLQLWWRDIRRFLAWLSAGEELPGTGEPPTRSPHRSIAQFAGWLFAAERLPLAEPPLAEHAPTTAGLVRWCLSPDTLPEEPPKDTDRRSIGPLARWLLAPEHLPIAEADTVGKGSSTVKWLLSSEPLPPPMHDSTTSRSQEA